MSTLTSNANNNNNNNLIANNASSAQLSNVNNNNSPNTINNNNTNSPAGAPTATQNSHHHSHHHQYQSALASGVSRLFARSMSSASANGGAGGVGAAGSTSGGPSAVAAGGTGGGLGAAATPAIAIPAELNVMLHGYHKKLKTNKKKYFVVYGDTPDKSARLEYFDSEKKFKQSWLKSTSVQAKRSIVLRSCFNINKRHDIKKHVIALYTKDDCFCIVFDSEEELNRWLRTLLSLQRGEESEGEPPRPTFEHVWDVFVERKGLGDSCGILGTYRLCITDKTLSLVRIGPPTTNSGDARVEVVEFSLASIRRCGASQRYFYLEVGRSSKIGPGEIWMEAPDAIIAHNMHTTIMKPTKNREVDGLGPIPRNRSSSANAASKPTAMLGRRQTYTGQKPVNCSPSGEDQRSPHASHAQSSESSSSATSTNTVVMVPQNPANSSQNLKSTQNHHPNSDKPCTSISSVPAAVAVGSSGVVAGFPAAGSSQPSSNSCGHPAGVLTGSHPHPHHPSPTPSYSRSAIKKPKLAPPPEEEGSASSFRSYTSIAREPTAPGGTSSTATPPLMMMMMQHHTGPSPAGGANNVTSSTATSVVVGTNGSSGAIATTISTTSLASTSESPSPSDHGAAIARERCDSLPSRNRTTSETSTHQQQLIMNSGGMPPPRTIPSASFNRPQSMIVNRQSHSHSPPVHSSPLSPPSGACSTGSDGSSFSIDEPDSYNSSHTPDEGNGFPKVINHLSSGCSIPEENSEEYINNYGKVPLRPQHRSMDEFVSHAIRRGSPAPPANIVDNSSSSNYMEMCSPCGSSPGDPSGNSGYIPMSPSTDFPRGLYSSSAHSRTSSLAEDTVDAYVPMAAPGHNTEEYVDMDPSHNSSSNRTLAAATTASQAATTAGGNGNISSAASSCSITSGTPSTDMRFSGYHLDKVEARFTPSEDDEMERPLRTYSVGSRLEHNKRKLRVDMLSSEGSSNSRVRAFSVGSRAKVPRSDVYKGSGAPITAPLLSAGSSGSLQETSSNSGSITNCAPLASTNARGSNSSMNEGRTGKKSSSAPTLAAKPHGSFDPIMDDLMEIDYSAPQFHGEPTASSSTPQKTSGMEDYMEMTAGGGNKRNTGYVEMKPGHIPPVNTSSHENSDYLDMRPGTGYEPNPSTKSKSSPIKINSPKKFSGGGNNNNNYLEMSPRMMGTSSSSSSSMTNRKPTAPSEDYLNISPLMMTSAGGDSGNEEKMINEEEEDEEEVVAPSSAPDVYMEMTWSQPKTSLDSSKPVSDDYINMDYSRKDVSGSSSALDSRLSSMPIAIQSGSAGRTLQGDLMEPKIGGAPSNIPNYLPLNSSTTRHQGAAQIGFSPKQNSLRSRCDSRDSGIVTPSGSQVTIFPFSPGSPIKSFSLGVENPSAEERKCFVDATTGTLRISETDEDNSEESNEFLADQPQSSQPKDAAESSKLEDLSHNYAELSIGQQQQQQQTQQKTEKSHPSSFSSTKKANLSLILTTSTNTRTTPTITAMKSAVEYPDYVNCTPVTTPVVTKPTTPMAVDDQAGDYAIMNPASLRKLSSTSQSELSSTESGLPPLTKKSNQIFKPITSSQDEAFLKKPSGASPKPAFNRQYSERRVPGPSGIDSSGYEMLQRTSRPNSVNSEKITNKCPPSAGSTRPSSANSDRLPIISATSSSASSTSTLCESKNQSPTASSVMIATTTTTTVTPGVRPDSVTSLTDPHIISRPPSVSSERELHYASLDLPPCTNPPPQSAPVAGTSAVPPNSTNRMEVDSDGATAANRPGGPDSLNSSPSPNSGCTSQQQTGSAFTYAQIDFVRSVAQAQAQQQSVTKSGQQQQ
ncbi:serine-rich adhesin for platelets isoform X7 [Aedes albopictus]|uniref:Insulin receptor substrate 1 n=1 Tax=Aedes albopictus TaxID=7160 RepID=A0ABM1YN42_AEDAL